MPRKFEILERAPEAPFKCIVTGLKGPVVDMDKFVPDYGRVYLHVSVIAAMAEKLGFLRDDVATQLRDELAAARAEAAAWPAALTILEEDIHDLVVHAGARARGELPVRAADDPVVEAPAGFDEADAGDDDPAGAGDQRAVGEGRGRVPADATLLFDQPAVLSE